VPDIFDKIPSYGLVHDWLGQKTVEGLLRFAQSNEHRFEDTRVTHEEVDKIDRTRRVSRKLLSLGDLEYGDRAFLSAILIRLRKLVVFPSFFLMRYYL
jgi:hypothetical protein